MVHSAESSCFYQFIYICVFRMPKLKIFKSVASNWKTLIWYSWLDSSAAICREFPTWRWETGICGFKLRFFGRNIGVERVKTTGDVSLLRLKSENFSY